MRPCDCLQLAGVLDVHLRMAKTQSKPLRAMVALYQLGALSKGNLRRPLRGAAGKILHVDHSRADRRERAGQSDDREVRRSVADRLHSAGGGTAALRESQVLPVCAAALS